MSDEDESSLEDLILAAQAAEEARREEKRFRALMSKPSSPIWVGHPCPSCGAQRLTPVPHLRETTAFCVACGMRSEHSEERMRDIAADHEISMARYRVAMARVKLFGLVVSEEELHGRLKVTFEQRREVPTSAARALPPQPQGQSAPGPPSEGPKVAGCRADQQTSFLPAQEAAAGRAGPRTRRG